MRNRISALTLALALAVPSLTAAQFSDSYNFLKAVKDRDGAEATKFVSKPGSIIIDTHDQSSGETALHIVTRDRDTTWLRFLLSKGAKPDTRDKSGETPLLIAARLNYEDGAELLLAARASVDLANNAGETALIRAVENGNYTLAKLLLLEGADPDKPDHIAGLSARDYAKRDSRNPNLVKLLADTPAAKPKPKQGPSL
jgi:hypothetical protein